MDTDKAQRNKDIGRMYECIDIQRAIDSGQFKTLDDVLNAVSKRAESINKNLKQNHQ